MAGDGEVLAEIYKERVQQRGYGSGAWGWSVAYAADQPGTYAPGGSAIGES